MKRKYYYLKGHMLEEVGNTIGTGILIPASSINPDTHCGRLTALHPLSGNPHPITEGGHLCLGIRAQASLNTH